MLSEETRRKLREMNFGELVEALDLQEKQPEYMALSFDDRMNLAVDYTYSAKYNAKVHRLISAAKFRIVDAALMNVYYEKRGLDKELILTLGNCGFIEKNSRSCSMVSPVPARVTWRVPLADRLVCKDTAQDTSVFPILCSYSVWHRLMFTADPSS